MSMATLNLRVSPRRILSPREAAEYCGQRASHFAKECPVQKIRFPNGDEAYDMRDLDIWLDSLKLGSTAGDDIVARLG